MKTAEIAKGIHRVSVYDEKDLADITVPGVTTNMYVVKATQPAIIQTMYRRTFKRVLEQVRQIVDPASLRYIVVPHHEGDSSGALNEWLAAAPNAVPLCSEMCAFLSLRDFSNRTPMTVTDGHVLDLGSHRLRFLITPMVNQWDSLMVYEETTGTLFPNDLFSMLGTDVSTDRDTSKENVEGAKVVGYQADDRVALGRTLAKIEALKLKVIATMHGPALTGHFDKLIRAFKETSVAAVSERSALLGA